MIAVSNTTPLRYLLAIGQAHLFFQLFEKVFVPSAVFEELSAPGAPEIVRHQILSSPAWLEVRTARATDPELLTVSLHRGEREAILLAEELRPDVLLIDEQIWPKHRIESQSAALGHVGNFGTSRHPKLGGRFPSNSPRPEIEWFLYI